ncbi:MAG TPA: hypothetical protein VFF16_08710 [Telluria sp.]|nr:hypothetical protein [Telluria sp.]
MNHRRKNSRLWARLRVLCCSGLDPLSLAPDAIALVRKLIPHAGATLFLTDGQGVPASTYQDTLFDSVRALCAEEEIASDRFNPIGLDGAGVMRRGTPKLSALDGHLPGYFDSLTYQYIVCGAGQRHVLNVRLEAGGQVAGLMSLYREPGAGFGPQEAEDLARVGLYLEHALDGAPSAPGGEDKGEEAIVVARRDGSVVLASALARVLLGELARLALVPPRAGRLPAPCAQVLDFLTNDAAHPARMPVARVAAPGGVIELRAQWLDPAGGDEGALIGLSLRRVEPLALRVWRRLDGVVLSPQQTEVAFWMGVGGGRAAARARMGLSEAVLRDCVKAIYDKFGCASESDLAQRLRGAAMAA